MQPLLTNEEILCVLVVCCAHLSLDGSRNGGNPAITSRLGDDWNPDHGDINYLVGGLKHEWIIFHNIWENPSH